MSGKIFSLNPGKTALPAFTFAGLILFASWQLAGAALFTENRALLDQHRVLLATEENLRGLIEGQQEISTNHQAAGERYAAAHPVAPLPHDLPLVIGRLEEELTRFPGRVLDLQVDAAPRDEETGGVRGALRVSGSAQAVESLLSRLDDFSYPLILTGISWNATAPSTVEVNIMFEIPFVEERRLQQDQDYGAD